MTKNSTYHRLMGDPDFRREHEEELLLGEAQETVAGLLKDLKVSQAELADRLGVSAARVSQILSGDENLTLRSLGALGWSLGVRFQLHPVPMADRQGTPALGDPPAPLWLESVGHSPRVVFVHIKEPAAYAGHAYAGKHRRSEMGVVVGSKMQGGGERATPTREGVAA